MPYQDYSTPADIWSKPSLRPCHLYVGQEADRPNESKAGCGVDPRGQRAKGIGKDFAMRTVFRPFQDRDVANAVEMLCHAYLTVKFGRAIASEKIVSGRSEFFNCTDAQAHGAMAAAYKKAKAMNYDAYEIGRYALGYFLEHLGYFPHDNKRNFGYIALRVLQTEGLPERKANA